MRLIYFPEQTTLDHLEEKRTKDNVILVPKGIKNPKSDSKKKERKYE